MLLAFSSPPFYTTYVHLPADNEPTPELVFQDPRYHPFFDHVLGAADGSHITTAPPLEDRGASRNRKGGVSQNIFACCTLDTLLFTYVLSGIEGSATDATVFQMAREADFRVPEGRYYLADAGYGFVNALLVPYRGVRYHLAEWGRAAVRYVFVSCLYPCISSGYDTDQQTKRNYSIYVMPNSAMPLSAALASSKSAFRSSVLAVNTV